MRRLPSLLLSFTLLPAAVLAAPVVSRPAPAPQPVAASLQDVVLEPAPVEGPVDRATTVVATRQHATEPFQALGVTWAPDPAVGELAVTVRTRTDGEWTDWLALDQQPAGVSSDSAGRSTERRAGTEPSWVGPSDGVQVRMTVLSGRSPDGVRLTLIDPGASAADATAASAPVSTVATAATAMPVMRTRAQWGADESIRRTSSVAATVQAVTIHHSASSNVYEPEDVPAILRSFYAYHVRSRGWSDIGYNVLVDKFGTAWEGRAGGLSRPVVGAHAGGFNTGTSGVSMIGTYESVAPPAPMLETVAQVAAWKLSLHHRDPSSSVTLTSAGSTKHRAGTKVTLPRIFAHRDVSATSCPGQAGTNALPGLRARAAALVAAAPAAPPPDPFGAVDPVTSTETGTTVSGWAVDPDARDYTRVEVTVDGASAATLVADRRRPDVAAAYPAYSANHGFSVVLPQLPAGRTVCVTARNQDGGTDRPLGCQTVQVRASSPSPAPGVPGPAPVTAPPPTLAPTPALAAPPPPAPTLAPTPAVVAPPPPAPTLAPTPAPRPTPGGTAAARTRLAGADRYSTAAAVVRGSFRAGPVPVAFVASGEAFADALSGGPAAGVSGGPVLPVSKAGIPASVRTELLRLRPASIVVLGGTGAVTDEVVGELRRLTAGSVTRRAGADRYDTASLVATTAFEGPVSNVLIANGSSFPDALAAGAVGAGTGSPVLLVSANGLPAPTAKALRALKPRSITVLGGTRAISDDVLRQLRSHTTGTVTRLAGSSRYETAARMSQVFWPQRASTVYLATGQDFPDALAGAPAAGRDRAPLLLVEPDCMPAATKRELDRLGPTRVVVLGGSRTVTDAAAGGRRLCGPGV